MIACYCAGLYRCEKCRRDVCYCTCESDGAPQTQAEVTAGHIDPTQARTAAWQERQELRK